MKMKLLVWTGIIATVIANEDFEVKVDEIFGIESGGVEQTEGYGSALEEQNYDGDVLDVETTDVNSKYENCSDYTSEFGYECVPYYQCENGLILTDQESGIGLIDKRIDLNTVDLNPEDSKCPHYLDVCCKNPDFIPPPPPKIKYAPQCGRRNQNGLGVRIQGFTESESQFGEWPHMCAILHEKPIEQEVGYSGEPQTVNLYQCGGSLIAPGVILTAAHCVDNFLSSLEQLKVRCGEWDTQNETEPYPHQDRYLQAIKIHPEFNDKNLHNDFAVLFTTSDFDLSSHIDAVCMPGPGESDVDRAECFATGWGKDRFGSRGEYQVVLKEIDLPLVENKRCQDLLRETKLGNKFKLDDSFLCAGGVNGKDTCHGDGGSPLVCKSKSDPDTFIQSGIVSWGVGCGEDRTPGVYASVAEAACWIDYVMSCHGEGSEEGFSSVLGYSSQECQDWVERTVKGLAEKKETVSKHLVPIVNAEIDQFNRCKVTWKEETQDGDQDIPDDSKLVQNEKGNVQKLNNTTDGGYGVANQNDVSSYVTESNEQQKEVTTNKESETPDDSELVKIEADNVEELSHINEVGYGSDNESEGLAQEKEKIQEEDDVSSSEVVTNEQQKETTTIAKEESYTETIGSDELVGEDFTGDNLGSPNQYSESEGEDLADDKPVHISEFDNNKDNIDQGENSDEKYTTPAKDSQVNEEENIENKQQETIVDDKANTTNTEEITKIGEATFPNDYVAGADEGLNDEASVEVNYEFENCLEYTEKYGYECVPYYQCHNGTIITDGAGLIDIRNGFGTLTPEDSKCPGFLDVCCKDPDFIPPPPPKLAYAPKCGRRNQNGLGVRIQGFTESESQFGEWPHMCAILHEKPIEQEGGYSEEPQTVNLYQCGGSLIAPGVILTAAHCVDKFRQNPTELKIRCGEWDTQNQTEPYPHQDRYIQALNIHPEFDGRNLQNDFAVLFTSEEFVISSHIDTVCLPQADELFDGTTCFATGWGKDKFGSAGQYQVVLKEIDLPVVSNYECQDKLRSTRLGQKYKLHDSFICAGGVNGKDTCKGDGGSPLVCPSKYDPNTYVQAGMVAWGIGCGEDGTPGVYASVSKALCWIDYAMTCQNGAATGDYNSYNGYTSNVCQEWMDDKIADLERKRDGAGKYGRIFEAQIQGFRQCTVTWEAPSAPLVDISSFERNPDTGYGNTETKADQTDDAYTDTKADQTDAYTDTKSDQTDAYTDTKADQTDAYSDTKADQTDGYVEPQADQTDAYVEPKADQTDAYVEPKADQTDGSYSDDSSAVKITQQTYTDDNSALVTSGNTDNYAEDTSADITEEKAAQNPY